jgi:magnesium-transporting ATPase (P-type)
MLDLENMNYYYEESPEEKKRKKKSEEESTKLLVLILKLIGMLLFVAFLYSSSIFAAYYLIRNFDFFLKLQTWEKVIAVLFLAYLISCLVFYLKGIMIVLRAVRNGWWVLIWLICFAFVCLMPAIAMYFILGNIFGPSIPAQRPGLSNYKFWSLVGAIIAGGIIYFKYGLSSDRVLKISAWAYKLGKGAGRSLIGRS